MSNIEKIDKKAGRKHSKTYMNFIHLYYNKKGVPGNIGIHLNKVNMEIKRFCKTHNLKLIGNDIYF